MNRFLAPLTAALALLLAFAAPVQAGVKEDTKANDAARVLAEIMRIPETSVPGKMFEEAHAIAVFPDVVKAGLVIGGRRGKGLISVRSADGTWSNPSFVTITGGSIGFQAGVQSSDVILVFRSPRGVDNIVNGKFTLGADASVAAGPVGRSAQASTVATASPDTQPTQNTITIAHEVRRSARASSSRARTRSAVRWWIGRTFRSIVLNERNARSTLASDL